MRGRGTAGATGPGPGGAVARRAEWTPLVLGLAGLFLVPWIGLLAVDLPHTEPGNLATAWVGLDAAEAVGLLCSAVAVARRAASAPLAVTATGVLLAADAWFDLLGSHGPDLVLAVAEAAVLELPLAAFCLATAYRSLTRAPVGQARPTVLRRRGAFPAAGPPPAPARRPVAARPGRDHAVAAIAAASS